MTRRTAYGFTLLELMVGVAVLAIVLTVGIPSFTETIRNNRLVSEVNSLVTALNIARSEAYKRGTRVSICPSNAAQTACTGTANWTQGWIVFDDDTGASGTLDGTDTILQAWPATSGTFVYTPAPATLTSITFNPLGAAAAASFQVYKSGCTGLNRRAIAVALTGRISLTRVAC